MKKGTERRKWKRFNLIITGRSAMCTVLFSKGPELECTLLDICCGGARLRLLDLAEIDFSPKPGQVVELLSFADRRYDIFKGKRGIVRWFNPGLIEAGISFDQELGQDAIDWLAGDLIPV